MLIQKRCVLNLLASVAVAAAIPIEVKDSDSTSSPEMELLARQNAAAKSDVATSSFEGALLGKCFPLDFVCKFNAEVQKVGNELEGVALDTFKKAMNTLFNDNIAPLIDKVQAIAETDMKQVDDYVNAVIDHITANVKDVIDDAAQQAKELAKDITRDIQKMMTKIIQQASAAVEKAMQTFFDDAQKLLSQINMIVQKGQCMEAGGAKQVQDLIYKAVKSLAPHLYNWSSCWRSLNYKITQSLEDLNEIQLYAYHKKCLLLKSITPKSSPDDHQKAYTQGSCTPPSIFVSARQQTPQFQNFFYKGVGVVGRALQLVEERISN